MRSERVRSEAIKTARTTMERIEAYWSSSGLDPAPVTREGVHAKLTNLEKGLGIDATDNS